MLFGIPFEAAVVLTGAAMIVYVLFGGMLATTWVQIVKAGLLLGGATLLGLLVLARFHFDPTELSRRCDRTEEAAEVVPPPKPVDVVEVVGDGNADRHDRC